MNGGNRRYWVKFDDGTEANEIRSRAVDVEPSPRPAFSRLIDVLPRPVGNFRHTPPGADAPADVAGRCRLGSDSIRLIPGPASPFPQRGMAPIPPPPRPIGSNPLRPRRTPPPPPSAAGSLQTRRASGPSPYGPTGHSGTPPSAANALGPVCRPRGDSPFGHHSPPPPESPRPRGDSSPRAPRVRLPSAPLPLAPSSRRSLCPPAATTLRVLIPSGPGGIKPRRHSGR